MRLRCLVVPLALSACADPPLEPTPCDSLACGTTGDDPTNGSDATQGAGPSGGDTTPVTTDPDGGSSPPPPTSADDGATSDDGVPDPSDSGALETDDGGPSCAELGGSCESQNDCCGWSEGTAVCVGNLDGNGASCLSTCVADTDCSSTCCADLEGGGGACTDASWCQAQCAPLFTECTTDDDCCGDSFCQDGWCTASCVEHADCPNECCSNGGWCIGLQDCQSAIVCSDGDYFCSEPGGMFVCSGNAWYPVDCTAACIDAGYAAAAGCGWADAYGDDACFCAGDDEPDPDPDPSGGGCDPEACNDEQILCDEFGCLVCSYWCEGDSCTQHCNF